MRFYTHIITILISYIPYVTYADESKAGGLVPCSGPDCNFSQLVQLAQNIINFFVVVVPFVAAVLFAYGGFLYITAAGESSKVSKAHAIFKNTVFGLVFTLAAWLVIYTILAGLDVLPDFWLLSR